MKVQLIFILFSFSASAQEFYYHNHQKVLLKQTPQLSHKNSNAIKYYQNEQGNILGITKQIILKISDESQIGLYAMEFNLSIEKKLTRTLYLVKVSDKNLTLETANNLSLKEGIVYAHPDFIKRRESRQMFRLFSVLFIVDACNEHRDFYKILSHFAIE